MYKCGECNTIYDLTDEHLNYIGNECSEVGICKTIIVCPGCFTKRIVGGESDWDEFTDEDCIMMFGYDLHMEDMEDYLSYKPFKGVKQ